MLLPSVAERNLDEEITNHLAHKACDEVTTINISEMAEFLRSGSVSQRTVILFEMQHMLELYFIETIEILVPVLCERVGDWCIENQIASAEALIEVIQKPIPRHTSKLICDAAFRVVTRSRTADTFEVWGEILVVALPNAQWEGNYELSSIIAILDEFTLSDEEICRKLVARVLGSLSACLSVGEVESYVLNRALHLADDSDVDVRGMVAESLAFIGSVVDIEVTETIIWPKLLTLLGDSDARIHAATLRTIAQILEAHRHDSEISALFKNLLPPVFESECEFARRAAEADQRKVDDDTYLLLEIFSEVFGPLLHAAYRFFADEDGRANAFYAFLAMSTCNGPIVRRYCAFNLPGVSLSLVEGYATELSGIVEFLSRDSDSEAKWNLAAGIHETCRILMTKESADNLFRAVIALLQDKNPLVRMNALEHFSELLSSISDENDFVSVNRLTPIFQNLTMLAEGNWRTQELLAKQLAKTSKLVPAECLRTNVLPLLSSMAEESTSLVRKAAMTAIATVLWYIPHYSEREIEMKDFISDWGQGGVYWMRIAFIDCSSEAVKVFSASLFEKLFSQPLFSLADDPVANVRMRLARMIREADFSSQQNNHLRNAIEKLQQDEDIDVRCAIHGVENTIKKKLSETIQSEQDNRKRETDERELQNRADRMREEERRKVPKSKVRASNLLLKLGSKTSALPHGNVNDSSPTSVVQTARISERGSSNRSGLALTSLSKLSAVPRQTSAVNEESPSGATPRKSLKNMLGLSADETVTPASPNRRGRANVKNIAILDLGSPSTSGASSPRKSLKNMFGHSGDEARNPASPSWRGNEDTNHTSTLDLGNLAAGTSIPRTTNTFGLYGEEGATPSSPVRKSEIRKSIGRTLAGPTEEPSSPSSMSRKLFKILLNTVVSGNRNR